MADERNEWTDEKFVLKLAVQWPKTIIKHNSSGQKIVVLLLQTPKTSSFHHQPTDDDDDGLAFETQ